MPRLPRFVPPGSMVELTTRTNAGQFHLKPCPELNARILGILGRALALYPIALHAFVFMSTHWHALATVYDAERLAAFLQYMNGNIAKAVQDVHGWNGKVWGGRPRIIPVLDDAAAEDRLRYILAHGAKEGLVTSPHEWPGVSSVRALALGEQLVGVWQDRAREARLRRRGPAPRAAVLRHYPIPVTPLPAWAELEPDQRQATVRRIIDEIERQARRDHPTVLGLPRIHAQDTAATQPPPARSGAPSAHCTRPEMRRLYLAARRHFVDAYRAATVTTAALAMTLAAYYPPGAAPVRPPHAPTPIRQAAAPVAEEKPLWHSASSRRHLDDDPPDRPSAWNRKKAWATT
jgi:hypothetical protein